MPLARTYRVDPDQLWGLIKVWDHQCQTPHSCPHKRGAVTRFAEHLGRHRESFWRLKGGTPLSRAFAVQISSALGRPIEDFAVAEEVAA